MAINIWIYNNHEQDLRRYAEVSQRVIMKLGLNAEIASYSSWEELLQHMNKQDKPEMILVDIRMPEINDGRELIGVLSMVPADRLIKEEELEKMYALMMKINAGRGEMFEFVYQRKTYKIALKEIRCFESDGRVIRLHGLKEKYRFYAKLDDVEARLADSNIKFVRVNKSFLVNVCYIREYQCEKVILNDESRIGIGKRYKDAVRSCREKISNHYYI